MTTAEGGASGARQLGFMAVLGVVSLGVVWAVTVGLTEGLGLDERVSYPIALALASTVNFFACRHLIFDARDGSIAGQAVKFAASIAGFRVAEFLAFTAAVGAGANYQVALVVIAGFSFVAKFAVSKFVVFR